MSSEIIIALIAAIVGVLGSLVTFVIGIRTLRLEREKLNTERERLKVEDERIRSEILKISAETKKLQAESDDVRRHQIEIEQIQLEIDKQRALALDSRRRDVYPEMLELVYRLRNELREKITEIETSLEEKKTPFLLFFGEELYFFTENLYKYRAFIDKETYDMLHKFKHSLQDTQILVNRITRSEFKFSYDHEDVNSENDLTIEKEFKETLILLKEEYSKVDGLYPKITENIQKHVVSILNR